LLVVFKELMADSTQQWFPNASNGLNLSLTQVFQQVLQRVYSNRTNIAALQAQVAALQAALPSANFPAHYNSQGTVGQSAYDTLGNLYFCYAFDSATSVASWVRIGPSGTSTTF
jgi:hypothetical protein